MPHACVRYFFAPCYTCFYGRYALTWAQIFCGPFVLGCTNIYVAFAWVPPGVVVGAPVEAGYEEEGAPSANFAGGGARSQGW